MVNLADAATSAWSTTCRGWAFFEEEYLCVSVPRIARIQNKKLGLLLRVLQASMLVYVISWGFVEDAWSIRYTPTPYQHSLWGQTPARNSGLNQASRPCQNPWSYWQNSSGLLPIRPTLCKAHTEGIVHDDRFGPTLFVPTFIRSEFRSNSTLFRNSSEQYLTHNPEQQRIILFHGFQVENKNGYLVRGSSASSHITEGMMDGERHEHGKLHSILLDSDGNPCELAGDSEWTTQQSRMGIAGTLGDWLRCAGVTLDTDPHSLMPDVNQQNLAPHLRTMGFTMQFDLNYQHYRGFLSSSTVVCYIRIRIVPNWRLKAWTDMTHIQSTEGIPDSSGFQYIRQYSTGVFVDIYTHGDFRAFDLRKALQFLISCTVLMQMPGFAIRFIALFGMGFTSSMYRRARSIKMNIYHDFHGAIAKILVAQMTYYALIANAPQIVDSSAEQEKHSRPSYMLTVSTIEEKLRTVFRPFIHNGDMDAASFSEMVQLLYRHLDEDRNGVITCREFVNSCIMQDNIQVQDFANFFGNDKTVVLFQRLMDTSLAKKRASMASTATSFDRGASGFMVDSVATPESSPRTSRSPRSTQGAADADDAEASARLPCDQQQQQQDDRLFSRILAAEQVQAELSSRVERLEMERLTVKTGAHSARSNDVQSARSNGGQNTQSNEGQVARSNGVASKQVRHPAMQLENIFQQFSQMHDDMTEIQEHLHRDNSSLASGCALTSDAATLTAVNDARLLCIQMCELIGSLEQRCAALEESLQLGGEASAWSNKTYRLADELSDRTQTSFREHLVESLARVGMSVVRLTPRQQQQSRQPQQPKLQSLPQSLPQSPEVRTPSSMPSFASTARGQSSLSSTAIGQPHL